MSIELKAAGHDAGGVPVYDLWIDGAQAGRRIPISRFVEIVADLEGREAADERKARQPGAFRTPEDHLRESWEMRECPKAW